MLQKPRAARDPLHRDQPFEYEKQFNALGIGWRFETNRVTILEAARSVLCERGKSLIPAPHFTIRLIEDPSYSQKPPWPDPVFRGRKNLFYLSFGSENTVVADLDNGQAFGSLSPAMVEDTPVLRRDVIACLAFTMATHGKRATHSYVHASAVARENKGLLLSGPPHAGKSTLAYACARSGLNFVADDVIYLQWTDRTLTAWGNGSRLRLAPDAIKRFPELDHCAHSVMRGKDTGVVEFDLEKVLPGRLGDSCEPMALIFLERGVESTGLHRLNPDEALDILARDLIADAPEVMEMHYRMWMKLAQRGSYLLRYGDDLDPAVRILNGIFQSETSG